MKSVDERIKAAHSADGEMLWQLVRDSNPDVIGAVVLNRNLTVEMAVYLAKRKGTSSEVLGMLAGDVRFKDSHKLKLAVCKNPKTPQKIVLGLLKFLRIFDLGDITRDQNIPVNIRQKVEYVISEKLPGLPSGSKIALAKRSSSSVVTGLMQRGDEKVIRACLDSQLLTEGHIIKILNQEITKPLVVRLIAESGKWSSRYFVKYALIRNRHSPMVLVVDFISSLKTQDLRDLFSDARLPKVTRPFIFRELLDRGESTDSDPSETYEICESDESYFDGSGEEER